MTPLESAAIDFYRASRASAVAWEALRVAVVAERDPKKYGPAVIDKRDPTSPAIERKRAQYASAEETRERAKARLWKLCETHEARRRACVVCDEEDAATECATCAAPLCTHCSHARSGECGADHGTSGGAKG